MRAATPSEEEMEDYSSSMLDVESTSKLDSYSFGIPKQELNSISALESYSFGISKEERSISGSPSLEGIRTKLSDGEIEALRKSFDDQQAAKERTRSLMADQVTLRSPRSYVAEIAGMKRAWNSDKMEMRRLEIRVKALADGIRRLKNTKEGQKVAEMAKEVASRNAVMDGLYIQVKAQKNEMESLKGTIRRKGKARSAEQEHHKKVVQELEDQLEAMRKQMLAVQLEKETTDSKEVIRMRFAFEKKLNEKEESWIQRLVDVKTEKDRLKKKHVEREKKLRDTMNGKLKTAVRERNDSIKTMRLMADQKDKLEHEVESFMFKSHG